MRRRAVFLAVCCVVLAAACEVPAQTLHLDDVADRIRAYWFYDRGYAGVGEIIGNVEAGHVWDGHQVLDGGIVPQQIQYDPHIPSPTDTSHATKVGGTMAGAAVLDSGSPSPTGPGIACGSTLWSAQIATSFRSGGSFSITGNSLLWPLMVFGVEGLDPAGGIGAPDAQTVDVVNSSWSATDDTGNTIIGVIYDYLATQGVTMVVSSGNSGQGAGTVGAPANGWNVIAVGASTGAAEEEAVTSFSSGGPTGSFNLPGTRIKPDIVAPGLSILMPDNTSPTAFAVASGTSFSAPIVAASSALLIDMGRSTGRSTDPRLVKAALLNSAVHLTGWSQKTAVHPTTGTKINYTPLDSSQGAGRVDLANAYRLYDASPGPFGDAPGPVGLAGWSLADVSYAAPRDYHFDLSLLGGETVAATLTWFMDRRVDGFDPDAANPFTQANFYNDSFDDLDLLLYPADQAGHAAGDPLAASISGWAPADPDAPAIGEDSVEHLDFVLPQAGDYLLRVRWTQEIFDFVSDADIEDFALAWTVRPIPGDANRDGRVNVGDLAVLAGHWGMAAAGFADGDFNDDQTIDVGDLAVLSGNWGFTPAVAAAQAGLPAAGAEAGSPTGSGLPTQWQVLTGDGLPGEADATPEPAGIVLLALGGAILLRRRGRRGTRTHA